MREDERGERGWRELVDSYGSQLSSSTSMGVLLYLILWHD
jgi:hypothetical protein